MERRFDRRWRKTFAAAKLRAVFPRPRGIHAVELWELAPAGPGSG
jgi:hypothetical protein